MSATAARRTRTGIAVEVTGVDGPVPFVDLFQGRDELVVCQHMWYDGAPHQGQCEGCTTTAWHMKDAVYLNARGVSFAFVTSGPWDEVAPYVEFMCYTQPWYSVQGVEAPVGGEMGHIVCFLRDGDRVFLTYSTTGRPVPQWTRPGATPWRPSAARATTTDAGGHLPAMVRRRRGWRRGAASAFACWEAR